MDNSENKKEIKSMHKMQSSSFKWKILNFPNFELKRQTHPGCTFVQRWTHCKGHSGGTSKKWVRFKRLQLGTSFIRWSCYLTAAWQTRVKLGDLWLVISQTCAKSAAGMRARPVSPVLTCLFYRRGRMFRHVNEWLKTTAKLLKKFHREGKMMTF